MRMNKKGHVYFAGLVLMQAHAYAAAGIVLAYKAAFGACILAALWHIPAWEHAKDTHTEAQYQASEQFPQQLFDKLPGGTPGRSLTAVPSGNGGNFSGGMSS